MSPTTIAASWITPTKTMMLKMALRSCRGLPPSLRIHSGPGSEPGRVSMRRLLTKRMLARIMPQQVPVGGARLRNDQARRQMGDAHGGIGGVHRLAAGAGGAESVDAQIFRLDLDVDFVGFGQHGDRCRRSVDAPLLLGRGNALYAMHAAFVFQP